jgi:hypothetical protein
VSKLDSKDVLTTDLRYIYRAIDTALSEIEAAVADGLVDESVLIELQEAGQIAEGYLK